LGEQISQRQENRIEGELTMAKKVKKKAAKKKQSKSKAKKKR
jgi:hypothetical protein